MRNSLCRVDFLTAEEKAKLLKTSVNAGKQRTQYDIQVGLAQIDLKVYNTWYKKSSSSSCLT